MSPVLALLWNSIGRLLEVRGLTALAESCFAKAVEAAPHASANQLRLGRALLFQARYAEALPHLEKAAPKRPNDAGCWNSLGVARREAGDMDGAKAAFEHALAVDPDLAQARNNYGNWLLARGETEQALLWFDKALQSIPDLHEALNNRVVALLDLGRSEEAEAAARAALETYPDSAPLHLNLGNCYVQQGKGYNAVYAYKKALALFPGFEEAYFNLSLLGLSDHLGDAISFLRKQIEVRGRSADLLNRLALACLASLSLGEAEALFREILERNPDFSPAYVGMGTVVSLMGDTRQALACYEKAFQIRPEHCSHSNILFEMNYFRDYSPAAIFARHREWAVCHEQPLDTQRKQHARERDKRRKLRIGYVSPDFHHHPVGYLTSGVLPRHDRSKFEVHCYSHDVRDDSITETLRSHADYWHDTSGLTDAALAERIFEDEIDILIDLSGHTGKHRLPAFARKPAPVQVTWLGYFHSTGMDSIDYFITDPHTSPKGGEQYFSEVPVYLPHTRFCYTPPDYVPGVVEPPCLKNGFITFGCFNKLAKMTDEVLAAWAQILAALPDSRLWLKAPAFKETSVLDRLRERFAQHGISPERLVLSPASGHADMLREYGEIDIALDPFPFTGGITTFEALLMGVPVVTLSGASVVARQSASILANLALAELVHDTIPDYVDGAVVLASDRERLAQLRKTLRPALEQSPLCDGGRFTADLEDLYRRMWNAWCDGTRLSSDLRSS